LAKGDVYIGMGLFAIKKKTKEYQEYIDWQYVVVETRLRGGLLMQRNGLYKCSYIWRRLKSLGQICLKRLKPFRRFDKTDCCLNY
jgi:hypothetical protein